jgi:S1-C subfamily serine protease
MMATILVLLALCGATALAEEARVPSAWIGVRLGGTGTPDGGATLSGIFVDSPADRAGLRARDVLLSIDGETVAGPGDLVQKIGRREAGGWVHVELLRQDERIDLDLKLGQRPENIRAGDLRRGWIGLEAMEIPPSLREHFGAGREAGVLVHEVASGSPAEAAGFRVGDVVYEVEGVPVTSLGILREWVEGGGVDNTYEFAVARDGHTFVLEARIDSAPEQSE